MKMIILVVVFLCLLAGLGGCGGQLRTPPWSDDEVEQMAFEKQAGVPLATYRF